jgi:hypothetical protein
MISALGVTAANANELMPLTEMQMDNITAGSSKKLKGGGLNVTNFNVNENTLFVENTNTNFAVSEATGINVELGIELGVVVGLGNGLLNGF